MAGWTPSQSILDQIVQLLKESHSPNTEIQRSVEQVSLTASEWPHLNGSVSQLALDVVAT